MNFETIICQREGDLAIITLNRPAQLNALNKRLMEELISALTDIEADDQTKVLILTGGEKVFGAGADLRMVQDVDSTPAANAFFRLVAEMFRRLADMGKPTIAAIAGLALGGGCELALGCDLRVAAENASFGVPEIKVGLLPGGGGTQRLPRIVGQTKAKEMLFIGDPINAEEAYRIGLVNKVVPPEKLMEEARALARTLASRPSFSIRMIKTAVNKGIDLSIDAALAYEARCFEMLFSTEDEKEGVRAFIEKRKPVYQGK